MLKVILICVVFPVVFATVMALISHWRDGTWEIHVTPLFLRFKKFAQQFPVGPIRRHVKQYWIYYAVALLFLLMFAEI